MALTEQWTRVILLVPPAHYGRGLSESLQAQFAAQDWFAIHINDPYLALAELGLREKSQLSRAAWGLQRLEQIGLVVLEPREWEDACIPLSDLTRAAEHYIPAASIWYVSADQLIPVYRPATGTEDVLREETRRPQSNSHSASHAPRAMVNTSDSPVHARENGLRIANEPARATDNGEKPDNDFAAQTRLSREEIEMLLDPIQAPPSEVAS